MPKLHTFGTESSTGSSGRIVKGVQLVMMALRIFSILLLAAFLLESVRTSFAEIRTAALLFAANFSRGIPTGMTIDRGGVWSVRQGRLLASLPNKKQDRSFAYVGSTHWRD